MQHRRFARETRCASSLRARFLEQKTLPGAAPGCRRTDVSSKLIRRIVLPLGTRVMLPSWIGLTLGVMKDTALVYAIGVIELLRSSQIIITRKPHEALLILAIAGLIYFIVSFPVSRLGAHLEKKWREND